MAVSLISPKYTNISHKSANQLCVFIYYFFFAVCLIRKVISYVTISYFFKKLNQLIMIDNDFRCCIVQRMFIFSQFDLSKRSKRVKQVCISRYLHLKYPERITCTCICAYLNRTLMSNEKLRESFFYIFIQLVLLDMII